MEIEHYTDEVASYSSTEDAIIRMAKQIEVGSELSSITIEKLLTKVN